MPLLLGNSALKFLVPLRAGLPVRVVWFLLLREMALHRGDLGFKFMEPVAEGARTILKQASVGRVATLVLRVVQPEAQFVGVFRKECFQFLDGLLVRLRGYEDFVNLEGYAHLVDIDVFAGEGCAFDSSVGRDLAVEPNLYKSVNFRDT